MARAIHTAISAACYFLVPLTLCVGLVVTGTFATGYLLTTNLLIAIVVICGIFVGLILILFRKYRIKALMIGCSVSLVSVCLWYFGEDRIGRYLYVAEIKLKPDFEKKCVPPDGIRYSGDTVRLCSAHDFNLAGWIDLIVKIDGSYPPERLINDINLGNFAPAIGKELNTLGEWSSAFSLPNTVIGQHLVADYYLIRFHMCGNRSPSC